MTPEELTKHLESHDYRFAKTMPQIPHFYTLRKNWEDDKLFEGVVQAIRDLGEIRPWPAPPKKPWHKHSYFDAGEWSYWSMGAPLDKTILINRAKTHQETTAQPVGEKAQAEPAAKQDATVGNGSQRIVRLQSENFMGVRAVEIEPTGNVVTISGRNGAGKTSVLDSICVALAGRSVVPKKPIRDGQEKAMIVVELDDLVVTRVFTASGSRLEVANKDGMVFRTPQAVLDKLVGAIGFDPLAFIAKGDKEQRQVLIELMGVDVGAHDKKITDLRSVRSDLMGKKKNAAKELEAMPQWPEAPAEEVSVTDLMGELKRANEGNKQIEALQKQADAGLKERARLSDELQKLKAQIADAERASQASQASLEGQTKVDIAEIEQRAEQLEATNKAVRENQARATKQVEIEEMGNQVYAGYQAIQAAEAEKAKVLEDVTLPLEGLSVDEDGVIYEGIPFSQVNDAKQREVSMAIQMALNPKLKVMLINGNGLDSDTLVEVAAMAKENDYQIWMEVADTSGKLGVVIEDGMVKGAEVEPPVEAAERVMV